MWAGRDDMKDYETVTEKTKDYKIGMPLARVFMRHIPTGLELWNDPATPFEPGDSRKQFKFGKGLDGPWLVTLRTSKDSNDERARQMGRLTEELGWRDPFRRKYGHILRVFHIVDQTGSIPVPWNISTVEILLNMLLVKFDPIGITEKLAPSPDVIYFQPDNLPTSLHQEFHNFVPGVKS